MILTMTWPKGKPRSKATRERVSAGVAAYAAAHPLEWAAAREKARLSNLGKRRSSETRRRISEAKMGGARSLETRAKIAATLRGRTYRKDLGPCDLCGEVRFRRQDHDHRSSGVKWRTKRGELIHGVILRGRLCQACNGGLGMFQDSPELLRRAAAYLEKWRSTRHST